ncbi:MAG: hypothetical protein ACYC4L_19965 [Chloroflexota bacterium]
MELRTYWAVIWRWRWLALAVAAVVFVATLFVQPREATLYQAVFHVSVVPNIAQTQEQANPAREQYYEFITAELLVDDAAYTVESASFQAQAAKLASEAVGKPVSGTITTKKAHKVLAVTVTADDEAAAGGLARVVLSQMLDPKSKLYEKVVNFPPLVQVMEDVAVAPASGPSRALLYMLLRVLLGLGAGLSLAFLLNYLDDSLRSAREVESTLGLPVLAEIPRGVAGGRAGATTPGGQVRTA